VQSRTVFLVLVGVDAASVRVAHSYFVVTDSDGNILPATPKITKEYQPVAGFRSLPTTPARGSDLPSFYQRASSLSTSFATFNTVFRTCSAVGCSFAPALLAVRYTVAVPEPPQCC
jgi:hypothetical protein